MIDSISEEGGASVDLKRSRRRKMPMIDPAKLDRLPPHSTEAEQGVLGCILWSPDECLTECARRIKTFEPHFYDLRHQSIYDAAMDMFQRREFIDLITLQQRLKDNQMLDQVGGITYISSLQDSVPSAANLSFYLDILLEKMALRRMIRTCTDIVSRAYENEGEVDNLFDGAEREIVQIAKLRSNAESCRRTTLADLELVDFKDMSDVLLGNDWIERGSACQIAAASGIGKSTIAYQWAAHWALGMRWIVAPSRPLKSVIIYAENSDRDNARALRSIVQRMGISNDFTPDEHRMLIENVVLRECYSESGQGLVRQARRIAAEEKPDLMWLDPLAAFAGDDISKQTVIASFLRQGLHPIAKEYGFAWMIINHFTKPSGNGKQREGWTSSDHQYRSAGSYDITGWTRAGITIGEVGNAFEIRFAKRGELAGATHPDGSPTTIVWARRAQEGIFWEQIDPPEQPEHGDKKAGQPSKLRKLMDLGLGPVIDSITTVTGKNQFAKAVETFAAGKGLDVSLGTCKKAVEELVSNLAIKKVDGGYIKA